MKIEVIYSDATIDVTALDIVDSIDGDVTDEQIENAIHTYVSEVISDREWPKYRLRIPDRLIEEVREALAERSDE